MGRRRVLTETEIENVKEAHKRGLTHRQISNMMGITPTAVTYVLNPRTKEQNKACNIPSSVLKKWDVVYERYGENGTHRVKNKQKGGTCK